MLEKYSYLEFLTWAMSDKFNVQELNEKIFAFEQAIISLRENVLAAQKSSNYLNNYNFQYTFTKFKQQIKVTDGDFEEAVGSRPIKIIAKFFDQRPHKHNKNLLEVLIEKCNPEVNDFIVSNYSMFEIHSKNSKGDAYIYAVKTKNDDLFNKLIDCNLPYQSLQFNKNIIRYVIEENDLKRFKTLFTLFEPKLLDELKNQSENFFIDILKSNSYHIFNYLMRIRPSLVEENLKRLWTPINKNGTKFAPDKSNYIDILSMHKNQSIFETILNHLKFEMIFDKSKEKDTFSIVYQYINHKFNQFSKKSIELPTNEIQKLFSLYDVKDLYTRTNMVLHILRILPLPWSHENKVLLDYEKQFNSMVLEQMLRALNKDAKNTEQKFIQQTLIGKNGNLFLLAQAFLDVKYMKHYSDFFLNDDLILEIDSHKIEKINKVLLSNNIDKFKQGLNEVDSAFSSTGEIKEFLDKNLCAVKNVVGTKICWAQNEPYSHEGNQWISFCNTDHEVAAMLSNEAKIKNNSNKTLNENNLNLYSSMIALMEKKKLEKLTLPGHGGSWAKTFKL